MPDTLCPQCGAHVPPRDPSAGGRPQLFCSPAHKKAFANLMMARGQLLTPLMQTWRGGRRKGSDKELAAFAFREACQLLTQFNAEDEAAGRNVGLAVAPKMAEGWRAGDRPSVRNKLGKTQVKT